MNKKYLSCLLIVFLLFLTGCVTVSKPGNIPDITLKTVGKFSEDLSVDLINNQPDTTPRMYAGMGVNSFYANYNQWTKFFIDKLTMELKERGAVVSQDSPNKLKVKLSDFVYIQGFATVRTNMKISLEILEKNWKKEWLATDVSGWSMGRAFGSTIYYAIKQVLEDPEIISLLKAK